MNKAVSSEIANSPQLFFQGKQLRTADGPVAVDEEFFSDALFGALRFVA
jgi:hypothetical protein